MAASKKKQKVVVVPEPVFENQLQNDVDHFEMMEEIIEELPYVEKSTMRKIYALVKEQP